LSDQTFIFDALWLSMSAWVSVLLNYDFHPFRFLLALVPFGIYKVVMARGMRPVAAAHQDLPQARLLFLRVFGSPSRSERLFDLMAARWLARLPARPDPDGRYRVHEFFCRADT
jgi:hypothetical protein